MTPGEPPVLRYARVGSALDVLHQLAERGAPHGTIVVADEQLQGRGRRGEAWHSPPGGLWLGLLHRPRAQVSVEVLSLRVGLAVAAALEHFETGAQVQLKWPNDLILAGRKLGGILCEARWQGATLGWVAIGVGLNVANSLPPDLAGRAVRLADVCPDATPAAVLERLRPALAALSPTAGGRLAEEEVAAFGARDWLRDQTLRQPEPGVAEGIDRDGALRVRRPDGSAALIRAGHVEVGGEE